MENYQLIGYINMEKKELVNHPQHYSWLKEKCGVEAIDIIRHFDFCLGNALKYIIRAGRKDDNAIQDLEKAKWYITDKINQLKQEKL